MDAWTRALLTAARRPALAGGEATAFEGTDTAIYDGSKKVRGRSKGHLWVTSHRIVWADSSAPSSSSSSSCQLLLKNVFAVSDAGKGKIRIEIRGEPAGRYCQLKFSKSGHTTCLTRLQDALKRQEWEKSDALQPQSEPISRRLSSKSAAEGSSSAGTGSSDPSGRKKDFSTASAGVSGIMAQMDKRHAATNATMQEAFHDLDSLMKKAQDMVRIADAFARKQSAANKAESGDSEGDEMRAMLVQLGIAAPVTKGAAGSQYHQQLSRQLAEWLTQFIDQRFNGMIATSDLYCLFNRARGTEMISPDDLMKACEQFERLKLPLRLRSFGSGVTVVQSASHSDEAVSVDLAALVKRDGPQTAYDVALRKKMPLPVAQEQLFAAERAGALCRDETMDGVVFYLNFFNDMKLLKYHTGSGA